MIPQQLGRILFDITQELQGDELDRAVDEFMRLVRKQQMSRKVTYIIEAFEKHVKDQAGITQLTITSAIELDPEQVKHIEAGHGERVETTLRIDPSLIGGVKVQAGNTVLDGSIKTQLARLHREL